MVIGIDVFREHFKGYEDKYLLIGGTACDLLYGQQGLQFRGTKDFDLVLCVEALDPATGFMARFWEFVKQGGYQAQQKGEERRLYRFVDPKDPRYPHMLELFSRAPIDMEVPADAHLVPIPGDEQISSLSAILLNDSSYRFLVEKALVIDGIRLASADCLIALKAHAWADYLERKEEGGAKKAAKHRKDIYRLGRLLVPSSQVRLPEDLAKHLGAWIEAEKSGALIDPKELGGLTQVEIIQTIQNVYFGA